MHMPNAMHLIMQIPLTHDQCEYAILFVNNVDAHFCEDEIYICEFVSYNIRCDCKI